MNYLSKPFDCDHTCEYCVVERCPERKQPEGKTQIHTQETWINSLEEITNKTHR